MSSGVYCQAGIPRITTLVQHFKNKTKTRTLNSLAFRISSRVTFNKTCQALAAAHFRNNRIHLPRAVGSLACILLDTWCNSIPMCLSSHRWRKKQPLGDQRFPVPPQPPTECTFLGHAKLAVCTYKLHTRWLPQFIGDSSHPIVMYCFYSVAFLNFEGCLFPFLFC